MKYMPIDIDLHNKLNEQFENAHLDCLKDVTTNTVIKFRCTNDDVCIEPIDANDVSESDISLIKNILDENLTELKVVGYNIMVEVSFIHVYAEKEDIQYRSVTYII